MSERDTDSDFDGLIGTSFFVLGVGIIGAFLTAVGRLIYYLKTDRWITSVCETVSVFEIEATEWCYLSTDWKGFDRIYNWIANSFDVSLLFLITGVGFFAICILLLPAK